jgi:hypothetical protein
MGCIPGTSWFSANYVTVGIKDGNGNTFSVKVKKGVRLL